MKRAGHVWAHVRRARAVLEHLESLGSLARVIWRGSDLGTWQDVQAGWQARENRIRFWLRTGPAAGIYAVSAVRSESWGVRVLVNSGSRGATEEIQLVWEHPPADRKESGRRLLASLRRWAAGHFPGSQVIRAERRADPAHTLSGTFPRLLIRRNGQDNILLAAPEDCHSGHASSILTQAILWRALLASRNLLAGATTLWLLVPAAASGILCHRARLLRPGEVLIRIYSKGPEGEWKVDKPRPARGPIEGRDFSWPLLEGGSVHHLTERIMALAPGIIKRYPRLREYDSLRILGLEFARAGGPARAKVTFGVGNVTTELTADNFDDLQKLVDEVRRFRCADSPSRSHPFYRAHSERWLEFLLLENVDRLFPELLPGFTYPQIPVCLGELQGRVDILSVDRAGRLVVMELKTAPDPDLPLQATDYWGRVIAHCRNGDFIRRGYFSGLRILPCRPRIYLVAPIFCFHDTTETVLAALNPALEVWKVAINEDWRAGVKVLYRARVICGKRISGHCKS